MVKTFLYSNPNQYVFPIEFPKFPKTEEVHHQSLQTNDCNISYLNFVSNRRPSQKKTAFRLAFFYSLIRCRADAHLIFLLQTNDTVLPWLITSNQCNLPIKCALVVSIDMTRIVVESIDVKPSHFISFAGASVPARKR